MNLLLVNGFPWLERSLSEHYGESGQEQRKERLIGAAEFILAPTLRDKAKNRL